MNNDNKDGLSLLPKDMGGIHNAEHLIPDENIFGHYIYLPSGYLENQLDYPLIVFLHGAGEKGNSNKSKTELSKILKEGIPSLIHRGKWAPIYPAVVVSPQCHDYYWDSKKIHLFISLIISRYRINKKRIYITGISMGGFGTFNYVGEYGSQSYAAAAVPICGGGNLIHAQNLQATPIWAFHGEADEIVYPEYSIEIINAINKLNPRLKAKLTLYPGIGHDSWSLTYDGSGMGKENKRSGPFNEDIYNWMFKFQKP